MDEEIKISEMLEAENINEEDFIPIIQDGINKKISALKVGTGGGGVTVVDNLTSTSTTDALSANMGRKLRTMIEEVDNITRYSTTETKIGAWIDGKPIYRKVIYADINKNGNISIQHGIENLKLMLDIKVNYNRQSSSGVLRQMINPRASSDGSLLGIDTIYSDYFDIYIPVAFGTSVKSIYAIMEYTKTTD